MSSPSPYLDRSIHASVLEGFHFALRTGGYLFLGSSESVDTVSELYAVADKKHRIFRSTAATRTPRPLPHLDTTPISVRPLSARRRANRRARTRRANCISA